MPSVQLLPKTSNPRPTLPVRWNKLLADVDPRPIVKFQTITKDGAEVIVGRVKVPTPATQSTPEGAHAYVLRRYDNGFISWTTMWRAAFPSTKQSDEKEDISWIRANYDIKTGSEKEVMRLAGVWIPPELAKILAPSFHLTSIVNALADAAPMEEASNKPVANGKASHTTTPSGPNKRRKETHESPANATPNGASEHSLLSTPVSTSKTRKAKSPAPSRTTPSRTTRARKTASPAPAPEPSTRSKKESEKEDTRSTPRRRSAAAKKQQAKHDESDDEDVSKAPLPVPEEDIAESQNLVQRLKEEAQHTIAPLTQTIKRTRDEAEASDTLNIVEHSQDVVPVPVEERAVVTNRRVASRWPTLPTLDPNQKAAAWGTIAFAIGWGATTFLPQFF